MNEKTGRTITVLALLVWIFLQVYTDVAVLAGTFCTVSFSDGTRAFFEAWCLCLLLLDILLYFFGSRKLLRNLKWYWVICLVCAVVLPGAGHAAVLTAALLPYGQMFLLSYVLLWEGLEVLSWNAVNACTYVLVLLLSAAHVGWIAWLSRRNHGEDAAGRAEGKRSFALLLLPVWAVLQLISGADTFFKSCYIRGAYMSYTVWSWFLLGLWCLGLGGLAAALFSAERRKLLQGLRWYWFLCALALAAVFALPPLQDTAFAVRLLYAVLTPLFQMLALCWLLLQKGVGLNWETVRYTGLFAGLLLCLAQFAYMTWLLRRGREKGAVLRGFVEPGTGAVE